MTYWPPNRSHRWRNLSATQNMQGMRSWSRGGVSTNGFAMRWRTYWCVRVLCRRLKKTDVMRLQQAVNALICSRSLMRPVPPLLISAAAELADANDKGRWPTWSAITVDDIRIFRHLWGSYTPPSPSNGARVMGSTRKSEDPEAMEWKWHWARRDD